MSLGESKAFAELMSRVGEAAPEPRLSATRRVLGLLDDPQDRFPFIHVTGTNGKTSTSRMAAALLRRGGLRVGLFTSPHLQYFNERIVIDGAPLSDAAIDEAWIKVEPVIDLVDRELLIAGLPRVTFFEGLTVLAFQAFADEEIQAAVIEVGMGGEWDSTNVADGRVAVFLPIALDHERQLGSTIERIAHTKSGIIKPGTTVVTSAQPPEAYGVIIARAGTVDARVLALGSEFDGEPNERTVSGQRVTLRRLDGSVISDLPLSLHGDHQAANVAVALAAVDAFLGDSSLSLEDVASALAAATSPGRLQVVDRDPLVLLDAAHNPAGAQSLVTALRGWPGVADVAFVLGMLEDKDASSFIETLAPVAAAFFVTQSLSPRAVESSRLARAVARKAPRVRLYEIEHAPAALAAATRWAADRSGTAVVVAGSVTLVGEILERFVPASRFGGLHTQLEAIDDNIVDNLRYP